MTAAGAATDGRLIVRAPNHLGDLVLALPALAAAGDADVLVVTSLAPLLHLVPLPGRILTLTRGAVGAIAAARALRAARYARGVLLPPSFSSALIFALGGVRSRRGVPTDGRAALLNDPAPRPGAIHRAAQYMGLVTRHSGSPPVPRLDVPAQALEQWRGLVGSEPAIGVFPGGNAPSRRWLPDRFTELVRRLTPPPTGRRARRPGRTGAHGGRRRDRRVGRGRPDRPGASRRRHCIL